MTHRLCLSIVAPVGVEPLELEVRSDFVVFITATVYYVDLQRLNCIVPLQ